MEQSTKQETEPQGGNWYDDKTQRWVRRDGQEVCQDHTGLLSECPFKHDGRKRT